MGLGKTGEGDTEQVGCQGSDGDMLLAGKHQTVVDLVGEDHQLMLSCKVNDLLQNFLGVQCARGVVGVDDNDRLGLGSDLAAHIVNIGVPIRGFIAQIVDRLTAGQSHTGGPQGIVGGGQKNLIAHIQQCLQAQVDQFADTIAGEDVVHLHIGDILFLHILHDGLSCRELALGVGVAFAIRQLAGHVVDHFVGGTEAEGSGIADVQLQNVGAGFFHAGSFVHNGAANVVQNIIQFGRLIKFTHRNLSCILNFCCGKGFSLKPLGRNFQVLGQKVQNILSGNAFAADILTHVAFAQLNILNLCRSQHIDLLHILLLHGFFQPQMEVLNGHFCPFLRKVQFKFSKVQFMKPIITEKKREIKRKVQFKIFAKN